MFLRDMLNLVLVNFMVLSIFIGLFLIIPAGLSLSFRTKTALAALKDRRWCARLVVGTAILSTSIKLNDDYMIGRLNILRLSHRIVALPLWLTMQSLLVTTSNGTTLKSSLLESPTYSVKLRKLFWSVSWNPHLMKMLVARSYFFINFYR